MTNMQPNATTGATTVTTGLSLIIPLRAKNAMIATEVRIKMVMKPAVPSALNQPKTTVIGSAPANKNAESATPTMMAFVTAAVAGLPRRETIASLCGSVPARPNANR